MISKTNPKLTAQIEQGSNHCCPVVADVIVADVQSLNSEDKKDKSKLRKEEFNRNDFKAVIVDEAHHAVSDTFAI